MFVRKANVHVQVWDVGAVEGVIVGVCGVCGSGYGQGLGGIQGAGEEEGGK
jgi:hypothetical protein